MGMTLQQIRDSLRRHTGTDSQDLDDDVADELISRAYEELSDKYPFREKDYRLDFVTSIDPLITPRYQNKYSFPANFVAVRVVSVTDCNGMKHKLERMTRSELEMVTNTESYADAMPTHYVRDSDCLILWPRPDQEYSITVRYEKSLSDLINANDEPDLPRSWHEIILLGAVFRGFLEFGDNNRAQIYKDQQLALIRSSVPVESKEEFDATKSGVEVLGREYRRRRY